MSQYSDLKQSVLVANIPCPMRQYGDYETGEKFILGSVEIDEKEILEFANKYDPQLFHVDKEAANESLYGGLIASGWHTGSLMMRLLAENFLGESSMGSPGLQELSWFAPVRPGDTLTLHVEILSKRLSKSKPDRGFLTCRNDLVNQHDAVVMRTVPLMMIALRS